MTIEERAKRSGSQKLTDKDKEILKPIKGTLSAYEIGYIIGATEQRAIDDTEYTEEMRKLNEEWQENLEIQRRMLIDKACEWLKARNVLTEASLEGFRKAMEE